MPEAKPLYINFFDDITPVKVNRLIHLCTNALSQHNPTELYFLFASGGGDVDAGFVLYNYLISLHGKLSISMHNTGKVDSIANVIFMGGQKRYAAPNASFLYHGVSMNFTSPQNRTQLKESLSRIDGMHDRIASTISNDSKLTTEELERLFQQGESKDVAFALEKGIIHEIKAPSIPAGVIHLAANFV